MIAYNKTDLDATFFVAEAENMMYSGFIDKTVFNAIDKENITL